MARPFFDENRSIWRQLQKERESVAQTFTKGLELQSITSSILRVRRSLYLYCKDIFEVVSRTMNHDVNGPWAIAIADFEAVSHQEFSISWQILGRRPVTIVLSVYGKPFKQRSEMTA